MTSAWSLMSQNVAHTTSDNLLLGTFAIPRWLTGILCWLTLEDDVTRRV